MYGRAYDHKWLRGPFLLRARVLLLQCCCSSVRYNGSMRIMFRSTSLASCSHDIGLTKEHNTGRPVVHMPGRHRFSVNVDFDYRLPPATISVTDVGSASLSVRIYASYLLRTLEDG